MFMGGGLECRRRSSYKQEEERRDKEISPCLKVLVIGILGDAARKKSELEGNHYGVHVHALGMAVITSSTFMISFNLLYRLLLTSPSS